MVRKGSKLPRKTMVDKIPNIDELMGCVACDNNDLPSGAHTCSMCQKKVHILPGCSVSIGEEEGFGEKRICRSCSTGSSRSSLRLRSRSQKTTESQRSNEMNSKEQWNKQKKIKRSNYIKPSPFWDLVTNVNKKVRLGFLSNGLTSKTIHYANKIPISLTNTCAFDSTTQV